MASASGLREIRGAAQAASYRRSAPCWGDTSAAEDIVQEAFLGLSFAYVTQVDSRTNGNTLSDRLWVADLATGRKEDLGPAPSSDAAVAWMDNSTLLAESLNGRALQRVNIAGRGRTHYLAVSDSPSFTPTSGPVQGRTAGCHRADRLESRFEPPGSCRPGVGRQLALSHQDRDRADRRQSSHRLRPGCQTVVEADVGA